MRKILFHTTFLSILFVCVSLPAYAQMKIGDSPTTITTGSQLDIEKGGSHTVFMDTGSVGIGDVSPASMLTVGSGDLFQVDSAGNIVKIRNVTTSFPSSQGGVGTVLTNDGSGTLTWTAPASSITADSLNFTDLSDSLVLDASTDISVTGSNVLSVTNSGSGLSFRVNDDTTSDTTPFVIDASGNVGIGTAAPTSKLVTIGDVNMEGVLKLWDRYTLQSNGTVLQVGGSASYTDMGLYTGGAEKVRINSSGNVGIGTTGPGVKLDISQAGDGNQIRFETTGGSGAGRMWTLSAWNSTPSNHFSIDESGIGQRLSLFPNGGISLGSYTTTAAPANGMIISGNVGIGTTSPTGSLEIAKSASGTIGPILSLVNSASLASGNGVDIAMAGNPGGSASAPTGRIRLTEGASAASTMSFWTYAGSGSLAERMRIDSNGNVGIGTTSPDSKLNVNGLLKLDMTGGDPTMQFRGAGDSYFLKWISASNILTFQNSSGVNQLSLNSGNVGIGTIAPGQKLSVIGTSYFSGYLGIGSTTGAGAEGSTMRIAKDNAVQGGGQLIINGSTDQTKRIMTGYNTTSDYGQIQAMNNLTAVPIALNPNGGNVGIGTTTPAYLLDVAGIGNFRDLITQDLTLSGASTSILSGYKGVDGYTNFSGGIGTGGNGKDSITSAQRLTSSGNLVNIGSYLGGEMLLTKSGTFAAKADYGTGTSPRSVAIGDLNGDGKADLAVANQDSATVSVFLNNGNGTFAAKADYVAGTSPRSVAIGDLNGDGKADLVVASQESTTISVFLNNGNGTFAAKADYATGTNPETVSIGDLNGDGKADLAVANYSDNTVSVFLNNGNGTFAAKADYGTGTNPYYVAIGDLDGDGKADLAAANFGSATVSVLLNNGNGTFAAKADYGTGNNPFSVTIGDLNGDGKADLAVANQSSSTVSVLLNNGNGTFAAKADYGTGTWPRSVAIGDLNGDGKADLAVANQSSTTVSVFLNNGNGTFAAKADYGTGTSPYYVAIGDLNSDGKADLAVANQDSATVSVLLNQTSPMFYAQASTGNVGIRTVTPGYALDVQGGDINTSGQIRKGGTALTLTCVDVAYSAGTGDARCTAQGTGYICTSVSGGGICGSALTSPWVTRCCKTSNN